MSVRSYRTGSAFLQMESRRLFLAGPTLGLAAMALRLAVALTFFLGSLSGHALVIGFSPLT